ncbi:MAG: hypothetical protein V4754_21885 [Pseudomonadota bacterium]
MLELIFEVVGEFLLQVILEALFELGLHTLPEPLRRPPNTWLAALGYLLFGAIAGAISLFIFRSHLIGHRPTQIVNLIVTPLMAGALMALMGYWRAQRGQNVLRIDRFAYGYLFALGLALVRFQFAH